jgi:hypothetical protein
MTDQLTVRLPEDLNRALAVAATRLHRNRDFLRLLNENEVIYHPSRSRFLASAAAFRISSWASSRP